MTYVGFQKYWNYGEADSAASAGRSHSIGSPGSAKANGFDAFGNLGARTPTYSREREPKPQGSLLKEVATMHAEAANSRFTTSSDH
jgi:hypothetical protein